MKAPLAWSLGLVTSVAAHASAAALVMAMLHPKEVPDQPPPQSELRIETQEVARSKAMQEKPQATETAAASAKGTATAEGVVPSSKATAQAPQAQSLTAAAPPAATKASQPPAQKLARVAPLAPTKATAAPAQKLASTALPAAAAVQPAPAPAPKLQAMAEPAESLAAVTTAPPDLPPATDTATVLPQAQPDNAPLPQAQPDLQLAAAAPTEGTRMTAALAWTGEDAQIDPTSLKAIQSFMQPGDAAAQADETHDALSAILTSAPCSRLQAEFNPATGAMELRGHVPDPALKGPILAALQAQLGTGIKVSDAMLILPRPQCGALSGIADVGLPQSQDQNTNPRLIGADAQAMAYDYVKGQTIELDIGAPDYDAYLYLDYFDAGGQVIHFIPNDSTALSLTPARTSRKITLTANGQPVYVGPPYGQEIAAAFAASAPLYDGTRPLVEPAAPYLDWLKTRVSEARARDPNFKGEWVYFFVSTKDQ